MEEIILTPKEKSDLKKLHGSIKEKRLADRIKCILLLSDGYTQKQVAQILLFDERTVLRYKKLYTEGVNKLLEWDYTGKQPKLSPEQEKLLVEHLEHHIYSKASDIAHYIKTVFDVDYSSDGLVIALHRLGFSYKKTKLRPAKADKEKQEEFLKKYLDIRDSLKEDEKLYFIDGVHPTHNSAPSYAWIKTGTEKEILSNTGRERININGAYSPQDHEIIVREDERINSDSTIELFKSIEAKHPELSKIYVISDNARYYYSKKVWEYLEGSKIEMVYLPSYSPNLNLIERLWKLFKKKVIYNKYYEKFGQFKNAVFDFFDKKVTQMKPELDRLMTEKFHLLS